MSELAYFGLSTITLIVAVSVIAGCIHERRLRREAGLSREDFAAFFAEREVPERISQTVYDHYKGVSSSKKFAPAPDHSLVETYWEIPEDTDEGLKEMLGELGIEKPVLPADSALPNPNDWRGGELKTVSDVVEWIAWTQRQAQTGIRVFRGKVYWGRQPRSNET
jgi:hypothetical protein